jgi:hypothetical protein
MPLDDKVTESLSRVGDVLRAAGVKWTEAEMERLTVVFEYSSLDKEFRQKFLNNPRRVLEDIGVVFPKTFVISVKERSESDAQQITFTLPDYVGAP